VEFFNLAIKLLGYSTSTSKDVCVFSNCCSMQLYIHEKCEEEEVIGIMQNILLHKVEVRDHLIKH